MYECMAARWEKRRSTSRICADLGGLVKLLNRHARQPSPRLLSITIERQPPPFAFTEYTRSLARRSSQMGWLDGTGRPSGGHGLTRGWNAPEQSSIVGGARAHMCRVCVCATAFAVLSIDWLWLKGSREQRQQMLSSVSRPSFGMYMLAVSSTHHQELAQGSAVPRTIAV